MYPINELHKMHIEELHRRAAKQQFASQAARELKPWKARVNLFPARFGRKTRRARRASPGWAWTLIRRLSLRSD
jgi:hypothetical protein